MSQTAACPRRTSREPLRLIRVGYVQPYNAPNHIVFGPIGVVPHWNRRGIADFGSYDDGAAKRCTNPSDHFTCVELQFMGGLSAFHRGYVRQTSWFGTLIDDKGDGSGLGYRRNRYYDPNTGRFTQEDPIGLAGGLNAYGYANGDPINFSDPFGLCIPWPQCAFAAAGAGARAGTIIGGTIGTVVGTPGAGTLAGAGTGRTIGAAAGFLIATGAAACVWYNSREEKQIKDAIRDATGERATSEQYDQMSEEFHDRKAHGEGGTKNKKGDFTDDELKQIAQELFGGGT